MKRIEDLGTMNKADVRPVVTKINADGTVYVRVGREERVMQLAVERLRGDPDPYLILVEPN